MTDLPTEYRTITAGSGWIEKTDRGRLRFDGRDCATFLHALVTNDVLAIPAGRGVYALYLTPQGRLVADLGIHQRGDHLLVDVPATISSNLAERFDQLVFTEDVHVSDVSAEISQLAVVGARAAVTLARALGVESGAVDRLPVLRHVDAAEGFVVRTDVALVPSFEVFVPTAGRAETIRRLAESDAVELSAELVEALRIEAGRPAFGVDMTDETIPLEAGLLDRAISLTKGCYVGQEVIVRVLHRGGGRVARRLVRLEFDEAVTAPPPSGTLLTSDGREIGRLTSVARSPDGRRVIALGYVRREVARVGQRVSAGGAAAEIRGSEVFSTPGDRGRDPVR
jgi:folate-binding protein YgfZ